MPRIPNARLDTSACSGDKCEFRSCGDCAGESSRSVPKAAEPPVSTQRFSTTACAPRERIPVWRELYGRTIAKLDFEPMSDGELVADATLRSFPGLSFVTMKSAELRFSKPRDLTQQRRHHSDIVDSGHWTGSQLGREVHLEAGDAVLCTNAEVATGAAFGRRVMIRVSDRRRRAGAAAHGDDMVSAVSRARNPHWVCCASTCA